VCVIILFKFPKKDALKDNSHQGAQGPGGTGLVIEEKNELQSPLPAAGTGQDMPQVQTTKTYIQDRKMRSESGDTVVIFDFDKNMFYSLNPRARTYAEMTLEQFKESQKQAMKWIEEMNAQMEQNLDKIPEEARKELMQQLESLNPQHRSKQTQTDYRQINRQHTDNQRVSLRGV